MEVKAPSRLVWAIAFFFMVLVGVFTVLLLWPKDLPTQTLKFWVTVTLFPVGIPGLIVLRRYSIYEGRKLDAELGNEAIRAFNTRVFRAASIPLAVLGTAHRISHDPQENLPQRIRDGAVILTAQESIATQGDVVKARWLDIPGTSQDAAKGKEADGRRRHDVTKWLFSQLIDDLLPVVEALPLQAPLSLCLSMANGMTPEENEALWSACWEEKNLRPISGTPIAREAADLMMLDGWMDELIAGRSAHVTIVVAVQLSRLLAETPLPGTAEAGVAVMLAPDSLANQYSLTRQCNLHRPERGMPDQLGETLAHALQWGDDARADGIVTAWRTGLDAPQAAALRLSASTLALNPRVTDLDQAVGHAGIAAPWLALVCAASTLCGEFVEQMVFAGHEGKIDCAVLKHTNARKPLMPGVSD